MHTIVVQKRWGGEKLDIREFIRPNTRMVTELADTLRRRNGTPVQYIDRAWRYVVDSIHTPTASLLISDQHTLSAYHDLGNPAPLVYFQATDFWAYPSETLTTMIGDCDDKCILLASLLRTVNIEAYCTVGTYKGVGHMWVTVGRRNVVLETTAPNAQLPEAPPYDPMFRFNEKNVVVLRELQDTPLV